MFETLIPKIVVSGLRGGSGKTILSLSLIASLKKMGLKTVPFKKGPDYIDAGWLAKTAGAPCYNLDLFMMSPEQAVDSFINHSSGFQVAVIEGNRGLYDGVDHAGTYSTAELAKRLTAPVIISIDCTKTSSTVAAMVLGCQKMDEKVRIAGVVLNRIATERQESVIRKAVEEKCNVPVLGAIPRLKKDPFPERHMGLTPFQEYDAFEEAISAVEVIGERYLDIDAILKVAENAGEIKTSDVGRRTSNEKKRTTHNAGHKIPDGQRSSLDARRSTEGGPRIGVIRDSAFQFYYEENFEELISRGAELIEVSPLSEDSIPDIDALYIGGGFPETHAIALAENVRFKESLVEAIEKGLPVYAECGGLMYLGSSIVLKDKKYPMAGVLPVTFGLDSKPQAHGYTIVEVSGSNPFFKEKEVFKGHEFHYSRVLEIEEGDISMAFDLRRGRGIVDKKDGMCYKNVLAAYTHLHALGTPLWADGMISAAQKYEKTSDVGRPRKTAQRGRRATNDGS